MLILSATFEVPWQNDPQPTIIFMQAFSGTHHNTGRQWRFIQAINMTYIPRSQRKTFAIVWMRTLKKNRGNVKFTWRLVQDRFPYQQLAVRRYFYSPSYYITKVKEIPMDEKSWEKAVVSTFSKDFSKKIKVSFMSKIKKALGLRKKMQNK